MMNTFFIVKFNQSFISRNNMR